MFVHIQKYVLVIFAVRRVFLVYMSNLLFTCQFAKLLILSRLIIEQGVGLYHRNRYLDTTFTVCYIIYFIAMSLAIF